MYPLCAGGGNRLLEADALRAGWVAVLEQKSLFILYLFVGLLLGRAG